MDDLVQWLRAQLDKDERIARAASGEEWDDASPTQPYVIFDVAAYKANRTMRTVGAVASVERAEDRVHIAAHDPARVLREIDAKRRTLAEYITAGEAMDQAFRDDDPVQYKAVRAEWQVLDRIIRRDAAVYSDRPGYLEKWRP